MLLISPRLEKDLRIGTTPVGRKSLSEENLILLTDLKENSPKSKRISDSKNKKVKWHTRAIRVRKTQLILLKFDHSFFDDRSIVLL